MKSVIEILSPVRTGEKKSVKIREAKEKLCDTGERQREGAGSAVTVSNSDSAVHQQRRITFWLAAFHVLSPQITAFTALLHLYVHFDCICQVSTSVHLTKEFLQACCKTSRQ